MKIHEYQAKEILRKAGVAEEIIEIELSDDEKAQLQNSADAVKELVEALARV